LLNNLITPVSIYSPVNYLSISIHKLIHRISAIRHESAAAFTRYYSSLPANLWHAYMMAGNNNWNRLWLK